MEVVGGAQSAMYNVYWESQCYTRCVLYIQYTCSRGHMWSHESHMTHLTSFPTVMLAMIFLMASFFLSFLSLWRSAFSSAISPGGRGGKVKGLHNPLPAPHGSPFLVVVKYLESDILALDSSASWVQFACSTA